MSRDDFGGDPLRYFRIQFSNEIIFMRIFISIVVAYFSGAATSACAGTGDGEKAVDNLNVNKILPSEVQQVRVQGKTAIEAAREATVAKKIVSSADLGRYGDSNLGDALQRVPGVLIAGNRIQLTGFSADYTQVLVDGQPPRAGNALDIPMSMIERVEIYRGGNAQFSSQAIAGTINFVLRKVSATAQKQFKLNASKGYKWSKSADLLTSNKLDKLSYSVSIAAGENGAQSSAPFEVMTESRDIGAKLIQRYRQQQQRDADNVYIRISPRVQYQSRSGTNITLTSSFNAVDRNASGIETHQFDIGAPFSIARLKQSSRSKSNISNIQLKSVSDIDNGIKLDTTVSTSLNRSTLRAFQETFSPSDAPVFALTRNTHATVKTFDFSGNVTIAAATDHEVMTGWAMSHSSADRQHQERKTVVGIMDATSLDVNTESRVSKFDLYAQDEWRLNGNTSIYVGGRSEMLRIHAVGITNESASRRSTIFSPVVQALVKLNEENTDRLRFAVSKMYKAPTDEQLLSPPWISINNSIENPNDRGNPGLRPEVARSLDSTFEHNGKNGWNVTVQAKFAKIEDLIRETLSVNDGLWEASYGNVGKATSKSIEVETQFPAKLLLDLGVDIDFSVAASRNWSHVSSLPLPGNYLTPMRWNASFSMDYKSRTLPLTLGVSARGNDVLWQAINMQRREYAKSPYDLSSYFLWKFDKKTQLRIALSNILKRPAVYRTAYFSAETITEREIFNPAYRRVTFALDVKL
ncbi:TonB-dependent receptor [Massilia atriviolacea]|uniref:TonB-dependent receptor n=1 Tax=Massilia atriviolacea TaxID=2495579 RepID=A0A430HFM0_9BURK|nr:TonB-dependent receptor [Massilia atriviolacea]RSZ56306.1 TonB-dependent receptor [Massilia atriviolacea]